MCRVAKLVFPVLVLAIVLPWVVGCSSDNAPAGVVEEGFEIGDVAPGFGLHTPDGQAVSLSQFRGRPVLLNFWASWCGPCREEMPLLQEISQDKELLDKGLVVLGVDLGESAGTVQAFMKTNGYSFSVVLDASQIVAKTYNVRAIPTTFFIDKDGVIKDARIGAFANKAQIMQGLRRVLP